jgi:hypothetical protein
LDNIFMQIREGYKYRLKTNRSTGAQFVRFAGSCRFVWNKVLSINEHRYFAGVVAAVNVLARGQRERLNACAHPQGVPGITVL